MSYKNARRRTRTLTLILGGKFDQNILMNKIFFN